MTGHLKALALRCPSMVSTMAIVTTRHLHEVPSNNATAEPWSQAFFWNHASLSKTETSRKFQNPWKALELWNLFQLEFSCLTSSLASFCVLIESYFSRKYCMVTMAKQLFCSHAPTHDVNPISAFFQVYLQHNWLARHHSNCDYHYHHLHRGSVRTEHHLVLLRPYSGWIGCFQGDEAVQVRATLRCCASAVLGTEGKKAARSTQSACACIPPACTASPFCPWLIHDRGHRVWLKVPCEAELPLEDKWCKGRLWWFLYEIVQRKPQQGKRRACKQLQRRSRIVTPSWRTKPKIRVRSGDFSNTHTHTQKILQSCSLIYFTTKKNVPMKGSQRHCWKKTRLQCLFPRFCFWDQHGWTSPHLPWWHAGLPFVRKKTF